MAERKRLINLDANRDLRPQSLLYKSRKVEGKVMIGATIGRSAVYSNVRVASYPYGDQKWTHSSRGGESGVL